MIVEFTLDGESFRIDLPKIQQGDFFSGHTTSDSGRTYSWTFDFNDEVSFIIDYQVNNEDEILKTWTFYISPREVCYYFSSDQEYRFVYDYELGGNEITHIMRTIGSLVAYGGLWSM